MKRILAVGVVLLFLGVTIAPIIDFYVAEAKVEEEFVEVASGIEEYSSSKLMKLKEQTYQKKLPLDLRIEWENETLTLTAILENDSASYVEFLRGGETFFTDTEAPFQWIIYPCPKMWEGLFGVRAYWIDGNSSTVEYWIGHVKGIAVRASITNESVSLYAVALSVSHTLFQRNWHFFERLKLPWQYWGEIGNVYVDAFFSFPYEQAHGVHYDFYIGTGMHHFHDYIGLGFNFSVYNTGDQVVTGIIYENATTFSGERITVYCDCAPFSLPPGWGFEYCGWGFGFPLQYFAFQVELTLIIGNTTYSKSGYEIGPLVILKRGNT